MTKDRNPRRAPVLPMVLAAVGLVLGAGLVLSAPRIGALASAPRFHGTAWDPPQAAADFRLVDHTGRTVGIEDFRGEAVLLFFGYTHCPDVCPLTLTRLDRVLTAMGDDADGVRVLLVTVDPARDTPAVLAEYVAPFGPRVTGLTGDEEALARMRKAYFVYAEPAAPPPALAAAEHAGHAAAPAGDLNHTPQVFGVDRKGLIRVLLPMERSEAEIADDVRALLRY